MGVCLKTIRYYPGSQIIGLECVLKKLIRWQKPNTVVLDVQTVMYRLWKVVLVSTISFFTAAKIHFSHFSLINKNCSPACTWDQHSTLLDDGLFSEKVESDPTLWPAELRHYAGAPMCCKSLLCETQSSFRNETLHVLSAIDCAGVFRVCIWVCTLSTVVYFHIMVYKTTDILSPPYSSPPPDVQSSMDGEWV